MTEMRLKGVIPLPRRVGTWRFAPCELAASRASAFILPALHLNPHRVVAASNFGWQRPPSTPSISFSILQRTSPRVHGSPIRCHDARFAVEEHDLEGQVLVAENTGHDRPEERSFANVFLVNIGATIFRSHGSMH